MNKRVARKTLETKNRPVKRLMMDPWKYFARHLLIEKRLLVEPLKGLNSILLVMKRQMVNP